MLPFKEIIEKLKDILSETKIGGKVFDKDVAAALGIPPATFATMKKRNSIPYEELLAFCAMKKISANWLFFDQPVDMLKEQTEKYFKIRYYADIRASAGGGAEVFDENYETVTIDETLLRTVAGLADPKNLDAIHVDGESMEPTLSDGSIVFIDRTQTDVRKEGIYIAATTAGLFIKRIRLRADGMVELISDNPAYAPEVLAGDEVRIVGKVVGNIESL